MMSNEFDSGESVKKNTINSLTKFEDIKKVMTITSDYIEN